MAWRRSASAACMVLAAEAARIGEQGEADPDAVTSRAAGAAGAHFLDEQQGDSGHGDGGAEEEAAGQAVAEEQPRHAPNWDEQQREDHGDQARGDEMLGGVDGVVVEAELRDSEGQRAQSWPLRPRRSGAPRHAPRRTRRRPRWRSGR